MSCAAWKSRGFSLGAVHEEMYLYTGAQVGDRGPLDGGVSSARRGEGGEAGRAGPAEQECVWSLVADSYIRLAL